MEINTNNLRGYFPCWLTGHLYYWQGNKRLLNGKKYKASKRVKNWVKENNHPRLKKGCGITTDGYVWVRVENENRFHNQVKLHRYLMEIKIGRKLKEEEVVHHIDGNKLNNSIDNLKILSRAEHNKLHIQQKDMFLHEGKYSKSEIEDLKIMKVKDFLKKYQNRTKQSVYQKRYRIKSSQK